MATNALSPIVNSILVDISKLGSYFIIHEKLDRVLDGTNHGHTCTFLSTIISASQYCSNYWLFGLYWRYSGSSRPSLPFISVPAETFPSETGEIKVIFLHLGLVPLDAYLNYFLEHFDESKIKFHVNCRYDDVVISEKKDFLMGGKKDFESGLAKCNIVQC